MSDKKIVNITVDGRVVGTAEVTVDETGFVMLSSEITDPKLKEALAPSMTDFSVPFYYRKDAE